MTSNSALLNGLCINENDVSEFQNDNPGLCGIDTSRMSGLLMAQLASIKKHRCLDTFSVTDVIQELEGAGRGSSVRQDPFKHPPLHGFWKAHFFDASFLLRNLISHWGLAYENSPKFTDLCSEVAADEEANPTPHGWQGRLAHRLTVDALEERSSQRKLTGEWIVYGKHNNQNYYLCIARHTKNADEDRSLYMTLEHYCASTFPFLFDHEAC